MTPAQSTPAVLYLRVSTREQGDSRLGLESQEARCREECERRGWEIVRVVTEVVSGDKAKRPLFDEACAAARDAHGVLVGASIDRIARGGPLTVLPLFQRAANEGWAVYALDMPEIDTTSPMGELVLTIIAAVARMEKRLTAVRTSNALKAKAERGEPVGRPRSVPDATIALIASMRREGSSLQRIADDLNAQGITSRMGPPTLAETVDPPRWFKQSVSQTLKRYGVADAKAQGSAKRRRSANPAPRTPLSELTTSTAAGRK